MKNYVKITIRLYLTWREKEGKLREINDSDEFVSFAKEKILGEPRSGQF